MVEAAIQDARLGEIVQRIVRSVHPERIILFGSRARGSGRTDSDYDLMIVSPTPLPKGQRAGAVYQSLWGLDSSVDVIWLTPAEFTDWQGVPLHVAGQASRYGQLIHGPDL